MTFFTRAFNHPAVIAAVISVSLGVLIKLVPFGFSVPTRAEVRQIVQTESPYLEDRKLLLDSLQRNEQKLDRLSEAVQELKIENAKIAARLGMVR